MITSKNRAKLYLFIFVWIAYSLMHTFSVICLINDVPLSSILIHSIVRCILLAMLVIVLKTVFTFGNFNLLSAFQQTINCMALCILMLTVWLGLGYLIDYLLWGSAAVSFTPLYPFYSTICILIFFIVLLLNKEARNEPDIEDIEAEVKTDSATTEPNNEKEELLERIVVKSGQKIHVVLLNDIIYLQADGDYVQILSKDGKYIKEQTLKYFQEHLPSGQFVRVHRSSIVNIEHIARIELYEKQQQHIILKNGEKIKVSSTGYKTLREALRL